ncbi:MAG TPA: GAF domain-containing sensor histidine kinase, partial [Acidobacteriota bacterium]|nr:GAF domain-containing sensor histidine kinase [Acidobacteriota bacterium]
GIDPELTSSMLDAPDYEDLENLGTGVVQSVTDVDQETRAPLRTVLPFEGLRSYMIVPLLSQATFIGSMNFGSNEAQFFTQEHLEIAKEVANQMALALRNADLFEKLSLAHQRLQMLNQKMLQAQEMERHHLARELHDEVGQALTALRIHLEEIEALAQNPFLSQRLSDSNAILERILNQIRNLSLDLRPLMLDDLGLVAALRWYASSRAQLAGFSIHFESDEKMDPLPAEIETVCFRVAQEAITNIVRHAEAKHVRLYLGAVNGEILLSVKDDGRGFDFQEAHQRSMNGESFGLLGMKERVSLVGGDLEIESFPACGTEIRMKLPLKKELQVRT